MARFGDIDTKQFDRFLDKVGSEAKTKGLLSYITNNMNEAANYGMNDVQKRSPVDTGTLRRAWQRSSVQYVSNGVQVKIYNNLEYAPYVENGHRTRNHKSWVEGQFFMRNTQNDIQDKYSNNYWSDQMKGYLSKLYD